MPPSLSPCQWQCCSSSSWSIISPYGTESRAFCIRLNLNCLSSYFQGLFSQLSINRSFSLVFLNFRFGLTVSTSPSKTVFSVSLSSTLSISLTLSRPPHYRLGFCICLFVSDFVSALGINLLDCHFFYILSKEFCLWVICVKTMIMKWDLSSSSLNCNIDLYTITNLVALISSCAVRHLKQNFIIFL